MDTTAPFFWGSATASYQCEGAWQEGGKAESMWDRYLHENDLENGDVASDHYHRYREDIETMAKGGQNAYRFSLSWPRIIKNREGEVNEEGIAFYNSLIDTCHEFGVEPFVTIYHWDLPQYWEDEGGWLNEETAHAFEHYARVCFDRFGDRVRYWATFNEPKWFVMSGYLIGNYPPALQDPEKCAHAAFNVMYASALGVKAFRAGGYEGSIGIVHSFGPVDGVDDTLETKIAMRFADNYANNWILDTAATGELPIDLLTDLNRRFDLSYITPDKLQALREGTVDFLGLNYYARVLVRPYTDGETQLVVNNSGSAFKGSQRVVIKGWFEQVLDDPNMQTTEWGTEIYPDGLRRGLIEVTRRYHLPIYITENGIGVAEDVSQGEVQDDYRIAFMKDHIAAIKAAQEAGADVRGYFVWSTFDLYSWKNGCRKRYGLVAVDFENGYTRTPKKSYRWYRDFIAGEQTGKPYQEEGQR